MTEMERQRRRTLNRRIFKVTSEKIISSPLLWESTRKSLEKSRIFEADEAIAAGHDITPGAEIILSKEKTINAALHYKRERVAIHNFASATNPGGGVRGGSGAQEESICRSTTLYYVLDNYALSRYYSIHHDMKDNPEAFLYTSALIYTPDIMIIRKDDDGCAFLPEEEYMKCDVVTIAAPHIGFSSMEYSRRNYKKLMNHFIERFDKFFAISSASGCSVAITGAFGCGAFHNDPYLVAEALKTSIMKYRTKFRTIELAIFCNDSEDKNYKAFYDVLKDMLNN